MSFLQNLFARENRSKTDVRQLSLKDRISALKNLPRFFRLVWETNPGITIMNALLRVLRSAIPLAILYVGKLIIDQIILLHQKGGESSHRLFVLIAMEFGL